MTHIRWLIRRDFPEVLEIERLSFDFQWSEEAFIRCLLQRNHIGLVAEFEERVVGFMIYELHKTRLHVLNFAVHPDEQRRGIGREMVDKLKSKLSPIRRNRLTAMIRDTNLDGHLFAKACGMTCEDIIPSPYVETDEDAYWFEYQVASEKESVFAGARDEVKRC